MFDHINAERPRVLVISARGNYRAVATFGFNGAGNKSGSVTLTVLGNADGTGARPSGVSASYESTVRDTRANIESGLFELGYACDSQGNRLDPVTGEAWATICNNVREARVAKSQAQAAVSAAQETLRQAEAVLATATTADANAVRIFNSSL